VTDLVAELQSLVAAWGTHRSAKLADSIDELSAWFELVLPDLAGTPRNERHAAWLARASTRSIVDLPQLLANGGQGTRDQVIEQLEQLAMWEPDPRTTRLARRLLEASWMSTSLSRRVWRAYFDLVERHGDPRMLPIFVHATRTRPIFRDAERGPIVQERAAAIVAYLESKVVADDSRHAPLVARITDALASGLALRDAARLGDVAARSVYIDWLIDRGFTP
jgi:hypothetical protein